jgi:hypothetical protein
MSTILTTDMAVIDAVLAYIHRATDPQWCARVAALVCKRWHAVIGDSPIYRYIAKTYPRDAGNALTDFARDAKGLERGREWAFYSTPLLSMTYTRGVLPLNTMEMRIWFVTIYKFDPVDRIFIRLRMAPSGTLAVNMYLRHGRLEDTWGQFDIQVVTDQFIADVGMQVTSAKHTTNGQRIDEFTSLIGAIKGVHETADGPRYDRDGVVLPLSPLSGLLEHRGGDVLAYIATHCGDIMDAMRAPSVDLGRRLPGLLKPL